MKAKLVVVGSHGVLIWVISRLYSRSWLSKPYLNSVICQSLKKKKKKIHIKFSLVVFYNPFLITIRTKWWWDFYFYFLWWWTKEVSIIIELGFNNFSTWNWLNIEHNRKWNPKASEWVNEIRYRVKLKYNSLSQVY